mmetsp:Transcript_3129/g.7318  ORF Transcript_3129/g.7318 Transcript_3129/m.7318 type:complete len:213 (-) Transcript_3129:101-739(-)
MVCMRGSAARRFTASLALSVAAWLSLNFLAETFVPQALGVVRRQGSREFSKQAQGHSGGLIGASTSGSTGSTLPALAIGAGALAGGLAVFRRRSQRPAQTGRKGVREEFEKEVESEKAILFIRAGCMKCDMARESLNDIGMTYKMVELENEIGQAQQGNTEDYKEYMKLKTGTDELPQVHFVGGMGFGGVDNILDALDSGDLEEVGQRAGCC